ncbi:MAG: hypothetical protein FWC73_10965 [Defluviitaleaceae bacterium]|nr:hypothetical protein [Defluviitaleaceae bacterium]
MTKETFDDIWNIIKDTADAIQNDTNGMAKFDNHQKSTVFHHYEYLNALSKNRHMAKSRNGILCEKRDVVARTEEEIRLDRHKVSSCIACALLRVHPMEVIPNNEAKTNLSYYANEVLAFFVALSVMRSFTNKVLTSLRSGNSNEHKKARESTLAEVSTNTLEKIITDGYVFPRRGEHDDYLLWQLIALSDINDFDDYVISLSCTLFLIEEYSIKFYQN